MSRIKWQGMVALVLIIALLATSCSLINLGGDGGKHRVSTELRDSHEGPILDFQEEPYEFERIEYYELGENAAELEDVEVTWNEKARFISDEFAEKILSAEARTADSELSIEVDKPEAIYETEEILVHVDKKVAYWVIDKKDTSASVNYLLARANIEQVFMSIGIPEQTVFFNTDNIAYISEGVTLISDRDPQKSSKFAMPFSASTAYAFGGPVEEEDENGEYVYEIDKSFLRGKITAVGELRLHLPRADVRYNAVVNPFKSYEEDFDIGFTAGEDFELLIKGELYDFERPIRTKLVTYGLNIGKVGQAAFNVFLVIDIEGSISFEYSIEQRCQLRAGIRGEKGRVFPRLSTLDPYAEFDTFLNVEGEINGNLSVTAGLEAGVYFNIFDYDLLNVYAKVAVEAVAEFRQSLTNFDERCFTLNMHFLFESRGNILHPTLGFENWVWWNPFTYWPDFEITRSSFDIYNNRWLIYEFERCSEDDDEGDFATQEQALVSGANSLMVRSVGDSEVFIRSGTGYSGGRTGHGNRRTDYLVTNIPPGERIKLEAPEYTGFGGERKTFNRWDGFFTSTDNIIEFAADVENSVIALTTYYSDDPVYNLWVRGPEAHEILSPTDHGGTPLYNITEIPGGTTVTLIATEWIDYVGVVGGEFDNWSVGSVEVMACGSLTNRITWQEPVENHTISFIMDQHTFLRSNYSILEFTPPEEIVGLEPVVGDDPIIEGPAPVAPLYNLSVSAISTGRPVVQIEADIVSGTGHGGTTSYALTRIRSGTQVRLSAPEYVGSGESRYRFSTWTGAVTTSSRMITIEMDSDKTARALYMPAPETPPETVEGPPRYTLTVNSLGDDQAGVDITSNTGHKGKTNYRIPNIASQAKIHLEAPEYLGSGAERKRFSSWSGAVSSSNRIITLEMDNNKTVTANYIDAPGPIARPSPSTFTLTVTSSVDDPSMKIGAYITSKTGHGGTTPYTITGIEEGTKVHLEAPAGVDIGTNFTAWSGDISDKNRSITFVMDKDKKVQANYWWSLY